MPTPTLRERLERGQVWIYLGFALLGLGTGSRWPQAGLALEIAVWPALALLLYATFTQVPLRSMAAAFADGRFLGSALAGNFLIMPALVWLVLQFTPADDALRLGLLLVLLVPCTDWFITFTQLGRGDTPAAIALTPVNLLLQFLLLPAYLWLMAGTRISAALDIADLWPALLVVLGPLLAAVLTEPALRRRRDGEQIRNILGHIPVPLLGSVIFAVAAAHTDAALGAAHLVPVVVTVAAVFLAGALVVARINTLLVGLAPARGRTLAFTLATRNSFLVLPVALALPPGWEVVALVIVIQALVELFGMIACLWLVPRLFPDR
ncbi:arsenic resistance protein [Pseudactinotalea sp. Z1739]|uniref:arsenic resistance protein n=1 Tax=Pseudactinotalea sp. Z1739 TaxID=3413028 RepID=UPI003C7D5449